MRKIETMQELQKIEYVDLELIRIAKQYREA